MYKICMRCPQCGYITFDHIGVCKNCGADLPKGPQTLPSESDPMQTAASYSSSILRAPHEKCVITDYESKERGSAQPPPLLEEEEEEEEVNRLPKGGFLVRCLALITDIILLKLLIQILNHAVIAGFATGAETLGTSPATFQDIREPFIKIVAVLFVAAYFVYFTTTAGQTPGKFIFHLKVIKRDGGGLDPVDSLKRFIAYLLSALPMYAGFIMIAFNRQKRGLHDIISHTYVIKTNC